MLKELTAYGTKILDDQELAHVRSMLRADPNLWSTLGDVATWTRKRCLFMVPERTIQYESVLSGMSHMRKELLQEGNTEIERIIVEQIITCWLQVGTTTYKLDLLEPTTENIDQIKRLERRYTQDQSRLTRCLALLTRTRKTIVDNEIKKRKNRTIEPKANANPEADQPETKSTTKDNTAKSNSADQESPTEEFAKPIPTSAEIPTVSLQIEDFIQRHSRQEPNLDDHAGYEKEERILDEARS